MMDYASYIVLLYNTIYIRESTKFLTYNHEPRFTLNCLGTLSSPSRIGG